MEISELYSIFLQADQKICTDTRNIIPGSIFFALKGDAFNGNAFARQALDNGCIAAVIDEPEFRFSSQCILVESVLDCLQELANYHRKQFSIPVIGITGSNGKTTTKELMKCVLSKKYDVLATAGNLNNHIGVPLTLLKLTADHEMAIIEMGANHPGEIASLCKIAEPDFAIVTNVGKAHIEGFGSFEGVKRTKRELYDFVHLAGGTLFANMDNSVIAELLDERPCVGYGVSESAFCKGELLAADPKVRFSFSVPDRGMASGEVSCSLIGRYNFENILAAVCIGAWFEVPVDLIAEAVSGFEPTNNRSQVSKTEKNTLILDAYNANPSSMAAALSNFNEMDSETKVVILGDMLELGNISSEEHLAVLSILSQMELEKVFLVGPRFFEHRSRFTEFSFFKDTAELAHFLSSKPVTDSIVLIKGSRGIKLETLAGNL